jgi:non-heme chloroperoxidase
VGDRQRSYKQQQDKPGVTEIEKIPGKGRALIIDSGWHEVAGKALAFVQRFT